MVLDVSVRRQSYVEDCEVCCSPIEVSYSVQDDALASFDAKTLELTAFSRENLCLLDAVPHRREFLSGELVRFQRQILEIVTCASCSLLYSSRRFFVREPGAVALADMSRV
jgi:hypothetical protein